MTRLFLDIETRSACDLRKTGQYVYAEHPSTEIIVICWAVDDGPVRTWTFRDGVCLPPEFTDLLHAREVQLIAHNASFERILLSGRAATRLALPTDVLADVARWDCTAARAAVSGLPRTLEGAANALGLGVQKDREGATLMLRMCKPRKARTGEDGSAPLWHETPQQIARLAQYCGTDVEVERAIHRVLPPLSADERATWELTERMNDRGVRVDTELLLKMTLLIDDAERHIDSRISGATGGAVPTVSNHMALTRWLCAQGIDDAAETGVGKAAVAAMLDNTEIDPLVRQVLALRRDGGGSSSKKYRAILHRLSGDGRLRGALVYCGAAATGRFSSRGAQLQNLPRGGTVKHPLAAISDILAGATIPEIEELHGPALIVASELLRPVFMAPPGSWLARGDYSQIEARVLAWLAGQADVLDAFCAFDAGTGPDLYKIAASGIYRVAPNDVNKEQRQGGKVAVLALGYQGSTGALQAMAKAYGLKIPHEERPENTPPDWEAPEGTDLWIVQRWRKANPAIVQFWRDLERAAVDCMAAPPGRVYPVGMHGISFRRNAKAMALRLPSGRSLIYWTPTLDRFPTRWGEKWTVTYRAESAVTKRWDEFAAYGGLWAENVVQATARDLMADALRRLASAGLPAVLTVHDEAVCEVPRARAAAPKDAAALVEAHMRTAPAWADGLPVAADASAAQRYVKG